jgi:peptide/nickel transport system substrate-binding protein
MASPSHPVSFQFLGRNDPFKFEDLDQWHQYNPTRSKQLLAEAGYPNGFEMTLITSGSPTNFQVVLAEYLAAIGVKVNFEQLESTVYATARNDRTYKDAVVGADHTAFHGMRQVLQEFVPDSPKNAGNIDDPFLTDLIFRAAYTIDADEQMRLLKQINDYAMDQCFAIETFSGFQMNFMQPWVHNIAGGTSGWLIASASAQLGVAWIDDTAPPERRGRLKT